MKRETFVSILSAALAEADAELLREAEGLLFWRKRELRSQQVQEYSPGQMIKYLARDGQTTKYGSIDHLNKYSVSIRTTHPTAGYTTEVVAIERVLGPSSARIIPSTEEPADDPK